VRVGLNATCLNDRPSGAKQRFFGIYGALFRRLPQVEFLIYEPRDCRVTEWFVGLANVVARSTPVPSQGRLGKLAAGWGYWRQAFADDSFDVFESMHLPMMRPKRGATVLTIHDVRGLSDDNGRVNRALFSTVLRQALSRADHVVTVSQAMREEILDFYAHTPVSVVYNGLDVAPFAEVTSADVDAMLTRHDLPREFVLAVGHFEARKNYPRLIEAMGLLRDRGLDCPLVVVGNDSGEGASLARQINRLGLSGRVRLLTGLTDHEVRCAYFASRLFVFPSTYEGFGIPILEAMAAGCPMVLSDLPVFREITEDQAIYFPPKDVAMMAEAIAVGLTSTAVRDRSVQLGSLRLADFNFERLAESMSGLYKDLSIGG
jgi:Glycosyltransferase